MLVIYGFLIFAVAIGLLVMMVKHKKKTGTFSNALLALVAFLFFAGMGTGIYGYMDNAGYNETEIIEITIEDRFEERKRGYKRSYTSFNVITKEIGHQEVERGLYMQMGIGGKYSVEYNPMKDMIVDVLERIE